MFILTGGTKNAEPCRLPDLSLLRIPFLAYAPDMPLDQSSIAPALPLPAAPAEREPQLFRFSLRHLFLYVSMAAVVAALLARLDGAWPMVIASGVALVGAHVLGTFLGTRLQDTSRDVQQWKARPGSIDRDEPVALPQPVEWQSFCMPETTPLAHRPVDVPLSRLPAAIGMSIGILLGSIGLYFIADKRITVFGLAIGSLSCGVMGGWLGLVASNFFSISRRAWTHATRREVS